jgi:GT2 family glycosyltransferase
MNNPHVFILLLNYRGTDHTFACLDSLHKLNYPNFEIVIIDNASPDNSVERLRARLAENPGEFHFIASDKNGGYSAGNNLGIDYALSQPNAESSCVWLLNNDTTVEPDALSAMVAESRKTGGLVGSLMLYPDGSYQQLGTRLKWWTGSAKGYREEEARDGMPLETITGASMLIPLQVVQRIGKLDESFFLYFEDGEYSLRCLQNGFPLTLARNSRIFHIESASTGKMSLPTQYYYHRNRLRLFWMYSPLLNKMSIGCYTAFRMFRTVVKSYTTLNPERRQPARISAKVQWRALKDFIKGVNGPCPHNLEQL